MKSLETLESNRYFQNDYLAYTEKKPVVSSSFFLGMEYKEIGNKYDKSVKTEKGFNAWKNSTTRLLIYDGTAEFLTTDKGEDIHGTRRVASKYYYGMEELTISIEFVPQLDSYASETIVINVFKSKNESSVIVGGLIVQNGEVFKFKELENDGEPIYEYYNTLINIHKGRPLNQIIRKQLEQDVKSVSTRPSRQIDYLPEMLSMLDIYQEIYNRRKMPLIFDDSKTIDSLKRDSIPSELETQIFKFDSKENIYYDAVSGEYYQSLVNPDSGWGSEIILTADKDIYQTKNVNQVTSYFINGETVTKEEFTLQRSQRRMVQSRLNRS